MEVRGVLLHVVYQSMRLIIHRELIDANTYINAERNHRMKGAKVKREETEEVYYSCLEQRIPRIPSPVKITYHWYVPNKKKDKSNIAFAKKFIEDGMIKAGVLKNDGWNDIDSFEDHFHIDKKNPRVEVEIIAV